MDDNAPDRSPALVLAESEAPDALPPLNRVGYVVAADGGLEHARRYGFSVDASPAISTRQIRCISPRPLRGAATMHITHPCSVTTVTGERGDLVSLLVIYERKDQ